MDSITGRWILHFAKYHDWADARDPIFLTQPDLFPSHSSCPSFIDMPCSGRGFRLTENSKLCASGRRGKRVHASTSAWPLTTGVSQVWQMGCRLQDTSTTSAPAGKTSFVTCLMRSSTARQEEALSSCLPASMLSGVNYVHHTGLQTA
jgi:hypothetical protein